MSGARTFVPMRFMLPSSVRAGGLRRSSLKRTLVPERHTRSRVDQYRNCYFNPVQCILMDARRKWLERKLCIWPWQNDVCCLAQINTKLLARISALGLLILQKLCQQLFSDLICCNASVKTLQKIHCCLMPRSSLVSAFRISMFGQRWLTRFAFRR